MLEDLCNLQHETLKKRDAYAKVLCNKINELTDDYAELEKAAKKLTKNYLINYKDLRRYGSSIEILLYRMQNF